MARILPGLLLVLCMFGLALPAASAQRKKSKDPLPLSEAGILSRQPQAIGDPALASFAETMIDSDWLYVETAHFRVASSLDDMKLSAKDRKRLAPELAELAPYFPELGAKPKKIPREVYVVLMGMRVEKLYAEFQRVMAVSDADFPVSRAAQAGQGEYMGDGPYLGEREKFEIVLHGDGIDHNDFTEQQRGIVARDTVRWHCRKPSKLIVSMPCVDGDTSKDQWLWPHLAHNVAHMLLDGFKFFAYDTPLWLAEGLALGFEKQVNPESWTRDGGEGVFFEPERSKDWGKDIKSIARKGKHTSIAKLMAANGPADLDRTANMTAWSMTQFLIQRHPQAYSKMMGKLKAQLDEQGYPTGNNLDDLTRAQFRELWQWTPRQFEQAWLRWVLDEEEEAEEAR